MPSNQTQMPGDWKCPNCNDLVFARNAACRRCQTPKPDDSFDDSTDVSFQGREQQSYDTSPSSNKQEMKEGDWNCPNCNDLVFARNQACRLCQTPKPGSPLADKMKPGDWLCPGCGDHQFSRNDACRQCQTPRPGGDGGMGDMGGKGGKGGKGGMQPPMMMMPVGGGGYGRTAGHWQESGKGGKGGGGGAQQDSGYPGDWHCPSCGDLQFARNTSCRQCGAPPPNSMGGGGGGGGHPMPNMSGESVPGDWFCPGCNDLQFARNKECRRCGHPKPLPGGGGYGGGMQQVAMNGGLGHAQAQPGDWFCQSCSDLQFARNTECRRCGAPAPAPVGGMGGYHDGMSGKGGGMGGGKGGMSGGYQQGGFMGGGMAVGHGWQDASGGAMGGKGGGMAMGGDGRPGDWNCPQCGDLQFARNKECRQCGAPKSAPVGSGGGMGGMRGGMGGSMGGGGGQRPGDWNCPQCGDLQFARNTECRQCGTAKPDESSSWDNRDTAAVKSSNHQKQKPGDWYCPQCNDLQFARNSTCRLCSAPKPDDEEEGRDRSRSPRR